MIAIWEWKDQPFIITMLAIPAWDLPSDLVLVPRILSRRPAEAQTHTYTHTDPTPHG